VILVTAHHLGNPRLTVRQFTADDVANLFNLNSDSEVMRYLSGGRPTPARKFGTR
jgi:hypothetical protein